METEERRSERREVRSPSTTLGTGAGTKLPGLGWRLSMAAADSASSGEEASPEVPTFSSMLEGSSLVGILGGSLRTTGDLFPEGRTRNSKASLILAEKDSRALSSFSRRVEGAETAEAKLNFGREEASSEKEKLRTGRYTN